MNRYIKAFCAGLEDYGQLYPRNYVSFKEFRYYMRGRRFVSGLHNLFNGGKRYD